MTVREAEWSADDLAAVLAAGRRANVKRSVTGYPLSEATDPANQGKFTVGLPDRDFALEKLQREQENYERQYPSAKGDRSLVWTVGKLPD